MKINIKIGVVFILLLTTNALFSNTLPTLQEALSFLNQDNIDTLNKTGEFTVFHGDSFKPSIVPNCLLQDDIIEEYSDKEINLGIESLFLYKDIDINDMENNLEEYLNKYYNIFNSISTLEGIEYWSNSRKKFRPLFTESWLIDDVKNKNRIDDPIDNNILAKKVLYAHQKDTTFGNSESKITYLYTEDSIKMNILNQTKIRLALIKVVDKEKLSIDLLLVPTQSGLLYYGIVSSKTVKIDMIQKTASKSFYNRIVAFNKWLISHIEKG